MNRTEIAAELRTLSKRRSDQRQRGWDLRQGFECITGPEQISSGIGILQRQVHGL